jgi:hypothetical protein
METLTIHQPKTPDQLHADLEVVNLERHLNKIDPLPADALQPEHELHAEYVDSLRQLRKDQEAFLATHATALEHEGTPYARSKEFFDDRHFSPLGWTALDGLVDPHGWGEDELRLESRQHATQSFESFQKVVDASVASMPNKVLDKLATMDTIWGTEKTQNYIDDLIQRTPHALIQYIPELADYLGDEAAHELIPKSADEVLKGGGVGVPICALIDPEQSKYLKPEQISALAEQTLTDEFVFRDRQNYWRDDPSLEPSVDAKELLANGLITPKQYAEGLERAVLGASSFTDEFLRGISAAADILASEQKLDPVKEQLVEILKAGDHNGLDDLQYCPILSPAERADVINHVVNGRPDKIFTAYAHSTQASLAVLGPDRFKEIFWQNQKKLEPKVAIISMELPGGEEETTLFTPDEQRQVFTQILEAQPELALQEAGNILKLMSQTEAQHYFEAALTTGSPELVDSLHTRDLWLPVISQDPERQKQIVTTVLNMAEDITMVHQYDEELQELIPLEEFSAICRQKLTDMEVDATWYGVGDSYLKELLRICGTDEVKTWVPAISQTNPAIGLRLADYMIHSFEPGEIQPLIEAAAQASPGLILNCPELILFAMTEAQVEDVLNRTRGAHPRQWVYNLDSLLYQRAISIELRDKQFDALLQENPAAAYLSMISSTKWGGKNALNTMRQHTEGLEAAPKWFKQFFEAFDRSTPSAQEILMQEAASLYDSINQIKAVSGDSLQLPARINGGPRQQYNSITKLAFIATHGGIEKLQLAAQAESLEELDAVTFATLEDILGVHIEGEARDRIQEAFEPFVTYLSTFSESTRHRELLAQLANSPDEAAWLDFRMIANSTAALETAQAEGLLPAGLSLKSHQVWRDSITLESSESLQSSVDDIRQAIRNVVQENHEFFGLELSAIDITPAALTHVNHEIAGLGQEIAGLHRQLAPDVLLDDSDRQQVAEAAKQASKALSTLQLQAGLAGLLQASSQAILAGGTLGADGQKAQSFSTQLTRLHKLTSKLELPQEAGLAIGRVEELFKSFYKSTDEVREITVTDTVDLATTLQIGAKPAPSCQHYATGVYRQALLGYTDPGVKIITVRDGDTLIARSIMRLLEDQTGRPALHVESIYTPNPSAVITDRIYSLAVQKAAAMGVPVYVSQKSQNADGRRELNQVGKRFMALTAPDVSLEVKALRAPAAYVDSAGGYQTKGYTIKELKILAQRG